MMLRHAGGHEGVGINSGRSLQSTSEWKENDMSHLQIWLYFRKGKKL